MINTLGVLQFNLARKIFLLTVQGGTFVDHLCYVGLVFVMILCVFIAVLWSPAGCLDSCL